MEYVLLFYVLDGILNSKVPESAGVAYVSIIGLSVVGFLLWMMIKSISQQEDAEQYFYHLSGEEQEEYRQKYIKKNYLDF